MQACELIITAEISINVSVNNSIPISIVTKLALSAHLLGLTQLEAQEVLGQESKIKTEVSRSCCEIRSGIDQIFGA